MSKILEDLRDIITNSDLSPTDQNDLLIFLPILPPKVLKDLKDIFEKSPKMLKAFNEDFKAKLEALIDGRNAYQKMVEKERDLLETWKEEFGHQEDLEEREIPEKNENLVPEEEAEEYLDNNS